jgi:hypothetical protein
VSDVSPQPGAEQRCYVIRREAMTRDEMLARGRTEDEAHTQPWPTAVHAYAVDADGAERQVAHVVHHSPDGFEYGYGGSGPADLARSILVDYFGLHGAPERLSVSYQRFKWQFVASVDRTARSLEIPGAAIAAWVRHEQESVHG